MSGGRRPRGRPVGATRNYSELTLKLLWGRAAGHCAMPDCRIELFADATDYDPVVVIGDNWSWDILAASQVGIWQIWVSALAQPSPSPERYLGCVPNFRDSPVVLLDRWRYYISGGRF